MKSILFSFITISILLFTACSSPEYPEFQKFENVKFKSASFNKALNFTLTTDAIFHNPNMLGADLKRLDLDVYVNDKKVSDVKQNITATINGNANFKLPLEIKVPLKDVLKDIKPSLGAIFKKHEITYSMKGTATVSVAGVDMKVPVDYSDKTKIKL